MVRLGTGQPTSFSGMPNEMKIIEWFFFPFTFFGFIGSRPSCDSNMYKIYIYICIHTGACVKYNVRAFVWVNSASPCVPFSFLSLLYSDHLRPFSELSAKRWRDPKVFFTSKHRIGTRWSPQRIKRISRIVRCLRSIVHTSYVQTRVNKHIFLFFFLLCSISLSVAIITS